MSDLRSEVERRGAKHPRALAEASLTAMPPPSTRPTHAQQNTHVVDGAAARLRTTHPASKRCAQATRPSRPNPLRRSGKRHQGDRLGHGSHTQQRGEIGDALPHARGRPHRADARDRTRTPAPRLSQGCAGVGGESCNSPSTPRATRPCVLQVRWPRRLLSKNSAHHGHDAPHHASDTPAPKRWGRVRDTRHSNRHAPGEPGALHAFENSMIH